MTEVDKLRKVSTSAETHGCVIKKAMPASFITRTSSSIGEVSKKVVDNKTKWLVVRRTRQPEKQAHDDDQLDR